jgi:hypothetical protein
MKHRGRPISETKRNFIIGGKAMWKKKAIIMVMTSW